MADTVGQLNIKLSFDGKSLKSSLSSTEKVIDSGGKTMSAKFAAAMGTISGIAQSAFSKVTSAISNSVGTAIQRVDTINNANKVFEALGYSSDSVSKSMSTLSSYLDGLPTSMTAAVGGVQALSTAFGGIENGTKYFIAMNDAGLAFGATSEQISNAITQLGQTSLDGPLDAETWNSLRDAGFGPVFAAMASEAGMSVGALKEEFGGNGTKTVQDFLNELVRLDTQGGGAMKSLSTIAKENTNGIGTALENVKNRISKAIANIISEIGSENIATTIDNISSSFSDAAKVVIQAIGWVKENADWLVPTLKVLGGVIATVFVASKVISFGKKVKGVFDSVSSVITNFAGKILLKKLSVPLASTVSGMADSLPEAGDKVKDAMDNVAKKAGDGADNVKVTLSDKITTIGTTLSNIFTQIGNVLSSVVGAIMEPIKALLKGIGEALAGFFQAFANPQIAIGAAMFAVAAAAVAAAILLIGAAIGATMPTWTSLLNNVILPLGYFLRDTIVVVIQTITESLIALVNQAVIPLVDTIVSGMERVWAIVQEVITEIKNSFRDAWSFISGIFQGIGQWFRDRFNDVWDAVSNVITKVKDGFTGAWNKIKEIFGNIGQWFRDRFNDAVEGIKSAFNKIGDFFRGIWENIKNTFSEVGTKIGDAVGGAFKAAVNAVLGFVEGVANTPIRAINKLIDVINAVPGISLGHLNELSFPRLAQGGFADAATAAIFGEAGAEVALPLERNTDNWSGLLAATLADEFEDRNYGAGGGITVNMTNEINSTLDADEIGNLMLQSIRRVA